VFFQEQPITPFVYEVVEPTTEQTTVIDVVLGAFSVVGVLGLVAVLLGGVLAGLLIGLRKLRGGSVEGAAGGSATRLGLGAHGR
jgi:hypothetical protein